MLSLIQIQRMAELGQHRRLVERILTNGRPGLEAAACRLLDPAVVASIALGLALQRVSELTYGPSAASDMLCRRLLPHRQRGGLFGPGRHRPIVATAVALRGLRSFISQGDDVGAALDPPVFVAAESALVALADHQGSDGGFGRDATDSALVLWQLGDQSAFRAAIDFDGLVGFIDRAEPCEELAALRHVAYTRAA